MAFPIDTNAQDPNSFPWYRVVGSWLWALIPLLSLGLLAWVPAVHAWVRLRQRSQLYWMLGLLAITVLMFALTSADDSSTEQTTAGALFDVLLPTTIILGSVHSFRMRRSVFGLFRGDLQSAASDRQSMAAVAHVERARARRAGARELAEKDPAMARQLHIGRPDLPGRSYDDGGLVDLNDASVESMVDGLDLTPEEAEEVARVRAQIGRLVSVDELGAYSSLPAPVIEGLRERAIFISR